MHSFKVSLITGVGLVLCFLLPKEISAQQQEQRGQFQLPQTDLEFFRPSIIDQFGTQLDFQNYNIEEYIDKNTYQLGPGDMFSIDLGGSISQSMRGLTVNGEGDIFIPGAGRVEVGDMTLAAARDTIRSFLETRFNQADISITLDRPRPVTIHVHGNVENPGKYTVPFQTRLDQSIIGAITDAELTRHNQGQSQTHVHYDREFVGQQRYSLRNIHVISEDGEEVYGDLVHYLKTGSTKYNPIVNHGDLIRIQSFMDEAPQVDISGGVSDPVNLEYRNDDHLKKILDIAGGFSSDADTSQIKIYRRTDGEITELVINPEQDSLNNVAIEPNDKIVVPIDRTLHQSDVARISGEIDQPGNYPVVSGETTVHDLLELSGGLTNRALSNGAYMIRSQAAGDRHIRQRLPEAELLQRTSDQFRQGFEYLRLETAVMQNRVFIDLDNEEQLKRTKVYDEDRLIVPRDEQTIYLMGQVNEPGHYEYSSNSFENYIANAGGYTIPADESRTFIIKAGSRSWYEPEQTELESGDIIFVDRVPYDDLQARRQYRQTNIQLVMTGISTVTSIITAYLAIFR